MTMADERRYRRDRVKTIKKKLEFKKLLSYLKYISFNAVDKNRLYLDWCWLYNKTDFPMGNQGITYAYIYICNTWIALLPNCKMGLFLYTLNRCSVIYFIFLPDFKLHFIIELSQIIYFCPSHLNSGPHPPSHHHPNPTNNPTAKHTKKIFIYYASELLLIWDPDPAIWNYFLCNIHHAHNHCRLFPPSTCRTGLRVVLCKWPPDHVFISLQSPA